MHCSSCGASLPPTSQFCPYCGTQIGGAETSDQSGPWDAAERSYRTGAQQEPPPQDASLEMEPDPAPSGTKNKPPRSSLKEPPRPRMPLWQAGSLWAATLAVVGLLAWGGLHLWQSREAVKSVTNHLNALMRQNYAAAYSMTAADFQKNTPEASYTAAVRNTRAFAYLAYYAIEDRDMADGWGIIRVVLIDRAFQNTQAAFDMIKENSQWRIYRVRLGENANEDPETIPVSTTDADPNSQTDTTPQTLMNKDTTTTIDVNANRAPNSNDVSKTDTPAEPDPAITPKSNTAKDGTAQKSRSEEK